MPNRDLVIQLRIPRLSATRWAAILFGLFLVGGGLVFANVMWTPFNNGEKLSSAKMNANFKSLADAIDANAPKPHLVFNNNDLGQYLGTYTFQGSTYPVVWSPTAKAPFPINVRFDYALFSGANCTGTLFSDRNNVAYAIVPYSNTVVNSRNGTIFQLGSSMQNLVALSYFDGVNCVSYGQPQLIQNATLLIDTKIPNLPNVDLTQTQLVLQ